jgi:hypothetical protein
MSLLQWACVHGRLRVCQFMQSWGLSLEYVRRVDCRVLALAAKHDHLNIFHFFGQWGLTPRDASLPHSRLHALKPAAKHGRLAICQFLRDWVIVLPGGTCERLTMNDVRADNNYALRKACKHGHLEVVRLLKDWDDGVGPKLTLRDVRDDNNYALRKAAACGRLAILQFLKEWRDTWVLSALTPDVTSYVHALYVPLNLVDVRTFGSHALVMAAHNGHLDVLKFLLAWQDPKNGAFVVSDVREHVLYMAAAGGHLAILQFLRDWVDHQGNRITPQDVKSHGNWAMRLASHEGHRQAVWYLRRWSRSKK